MNKIILIGQVGRDPEMRTTTAGVSVCSFSLAVNNPKKNGVEQPPTWFKITAWRQLSELVQKYVKKGSKVCVTGSVSVSTYDGKDGTVRASLDVTADEVEFLSTKSDCGDGKQAEQAARSGPVPQGFTQVDEDELPF